jgi:hypothetical protein
MSKYGSSDLCTNGHKNIDISGVGMKDKMPSRNSSKSNTGQETPRIQVIFPYLRDRGQLTYSELDYHACLSYLCHPNLCH